MEMMLEILMVFRVIVAYTCNKYFLVMLVKWFIKEPSPAATLFLTHFQPMFHFCTPWKNQKTGGFLEVKKWNSGWKWVNVDGIVNCYVWPESEGNRAVNEVEAKIGVGVKRIVS